MKFFKRKKEVDADKASTPVDTVPSIQPESDASPESPPAKTPEIAGQSASGDERSPLAGAAAPSAPEKRDEKPVPDETTPSESAAAATAALSELSSVSGAEPDPPVSSETARHDPPSESGSPSVLTGNREAVPVSGRQTSVASIRETPDTNQAAGPASGDSGIALPPTGSAEENHPPATMPAQGDIGGLSPNTSQAAESTPTDSSALDAQGEGFFKRLRRGFGRSDTSEPPAANKSGSDPTQPQSAEIQQPPDAAEMPAKVEPPGATVASTPAPETVSEQPVQSGQALDRAGSPGAPASDSANTPLAGPGPAPVVSEPTNPATSVSETKQLEATSIEPAPAAPSPSPTDTAVTLNSPGAPLPESAPAALSETTDATGSERPIAPDAVTASSGPPQEQDAKKPAIAAQDSQAIPAGDADSMGFFQRLRRGLSRTSENLFQGLGNLFLGRKEIDADLLEELESRLLMADVGVEATMEIIDRLTQRVSRKELTQPQALQSALKEELLGLLTPCEQALEVSGHRPYVILMVGVNGVGKTTTIGKLARRYIGEGRSVMLAAGDTFRAAAVEQLQVWGQRNNVPVVAQHTGADSASVIYDALQAAQARGVDVLIADTAGRLHNKDNLMEELKKVVRVMGKLNESAPHEVMLVLDAGTGQNALSQASEFQQWVGVTGITLTKLDGTAKGGVIFAIARKLGLPIRFIGVGEAAEDLRPFAARDFIDALFAGNDKGA